MYLVSGRGQTPAEDERCTQRVVELARNTSSPALRVWQPHRVVAFGRRDQHREGYDRAREHAREHDFTPVARSVGGHAVAFTGNTVAFALAKPTDEMRSGIQERYEDATTTLVSALSTLSIEPTEGEPDGAFCPGTHSLSARGKIAGLAQRVHRDVAVVSGIVVVCDHDEIAAVLDPLYATLSIPFNPDSVGSIARAGGPDSSEAVCEAIQEAFAPPTGQVDVTAESILHENNSPADER